MKRLLLLLLSFLLFQGLAYAKPTFPELTGRVVDNANVLTASQKANLSKILEEEEKETSNQIVIVTLKSLNGYDIADYGYQLGRYWGIGQKNKDNGVLLIASMGDRKLRIEVGYGLEGALTDKNAHDIIEYKLKPQFQKGNYYKGILSATNAIISTIKGEFVSYGEVNRHTSSGGAWVLLLISIMIISVFFLIISTFFKSKKPTKIFGSALSASFFTTFVALGTGSFLVSIFAFILFYFLSYSGVLGSGGSSSGYTGSSSGGFGGGFSSGGSFGGGGFSGGGGSFGGGGASGGW